MARQRLPAARSRVLDNDLEVEIDEEHIFVLSKRQMAKYSGRARHLIATSSTGAAGSRKSKRQRLVLRDFPGGAPAFEMAASFCYSGGQLEIAPSNVAVLRAAADELVMTEDISAGNLVSRTEEALGGVDSWQWQDLVAALKGCDSVLHIAENHRIVQRLAFATAGKISSSIELLHTAGESPMSPDQELRASTSLSPRTWWFTDVCGLSMYLMERVVRALFTVNVEHRYISRFLLYYLKTSLASLGYSWQLQCEVMETIVSLLGHLEPGSTTCRSLFVIYRMAVGIESSKLCRSQIERMIGLQLHNATLDNLLLPSSTSPRSGGPVYDADPVLRLLWYFLKSYVSENSCSIGEEALIKLGTLVDMYLSEVAPDPHLHPQKLLRLAKVLPPWSRVTDDRLYRAVDIYLEAHPFIRNAEALSLCNAVNYQKLSPKACAHIAQNPRFPAPVAVRTLLAQKELRKQTQQQQAGPIDPSVYRRALMQNEELRWGLRAMQTKVTNLEKMCKSMRCEVVESVRMKGMIC
ncbi:hypothetical protein SELMODRAFT_181848 [Selaginella moellendorffii]|uniref:NPH3 domain-containing protein n=1 Tax=Selaginella moellendorffii TaxID=88036 RepID=D8SQI9_SELML|nr:hypothetical protein SELMODRAFT_181848 [Selaginella moellendorffii]